MPPQTWRSSNISERRQTIKEELGRNYEQIKFGEGLPPLSSEVSYLSVPYLREFCVDGTTILTGS